MILSKALYAKHSKKGHVVGKGKISRNDILLTRLVILFCKTTIKSGSVVKKIEKIDLFSGDQKLWNSKSKKGEKGSLLLFK